MTEKPSKQFADEDVIYSVAVWAWKNPSDERADAVATLYQQRAERTARIAELEADVAEIRQALTAAGIDESEGDGGDTYYWKDTSYMAKEVARRVNLKCLCGWRYTDHGFYVDCTCQKFEPMNGIGEDRDKLADILRRIVASAGECDVSGEGAGVPLAAIDYRLIEETKELMK